MAERRALSLLDCAIVASAALVPVMVGVFALVAGVWPTDPEAAVRERRDDRYVSVRHLAALRTFERAIVARPAADLLPVGGEQVLDGVAGCRREWRADDGPLQAARAWLVGGAREPSPADAIAARLGEVDEALRRFSARADAHVAPLGIDPARWFAAASDALATPVQASHAPGRSFRVRCADLAAALAAVRRADGALLGSIAWRRSEGAARAAGWRPDQQAQIAAHTVMRRDPWSGAAGCIYLGGGQVGSRTEPGSDEAMPAARVFVAGERSLQRLLCPTAAMSGDAPGAGPAGADRPSPVAGEPGIAEAVDSPRWQVPPSLQVLLRPLESLRQPTGALYRGYTDREAPDGGRSSISLDLGRGAEPGRHRLVVDGAPIDVGYSIDLTIDPALQALAQKTAACYTGRHDVCRALGLRRREDGDAAVGARLLEGAMVRMAAIAVIDVASGRIEALAGALSPCAREEAGGPRRAAGCDARLPFARRFRPDALLNPAVYHDAMPASTVKPILAAAFLAEPGAGDRLLAAEQAAMARPGPPARDSLRGQLMRSDSARFLDRMFCIDTAFAGCRRPWSVQEAARAFGWNAGCEGAGAATCGQAELLFGRPLAGAGPGLPAASANAHAPAPTAVAYGRLMSEPLAAGRGPAMHLMPPMTLSAEVLRRCAAGGDGRRLNGDDWERCRGGAVVDVVAEGWGQGHARASALGVAGMMAALASAANGAADAPPPHLVASLHGLAGADDALRADARRWAAAALPDGAASPALSRAAAEVILSGLSFSHRAGTARTACEQVFDARRCPTIDWLAGKTGTPSFPSDALSLDEIASQCGRPDAAATPAGRAACGSLRPYKWYVAAFRGDRAGAGPWTHAIAVLTERNWLRESGRVHGAGDVGPNPSAEIALQIVGRRTGAIAGVAP